MNLKNSAPIIVGIGEVVWDIFENQMEPGGAPANFVYHAKDKGANAFLVTAIGNDMNGKKLLNNLKEKGISPKYVSIVDKHDTGTVVITGCKNNRDYYITPNVAWDYLPYSQSLTKLAASADVVCFGTLACRTEYSRKAIFQFIDDTSANCLKVFDVNLRQDFYNKELIEKALVFTDILKLNEEEFFIIYSLLYGNKKIPNTKQFIRDYKLKAIVITRGSKGACYITKNKLFKCHPRENVTVVDTVGCGDSFIAALTVGLLNNKNISEALAMAVETAANVCSKHGGMTSESKAN